MSNEPVAILNTRANGISIDWLLPMREVMEIPDGTTLYAHPSQECISIKDQRIKELIAAVEFALENISLDEDVVISALKKARYPATPPKEKV